MQLACSWLNALLVNEKEPSPVGLTPEAMGAALTGAGLEIEGAIERQGVAFSGVVVAKVLALNPHPNAEKLRLATLTTGTKEQTVVCGAQNLKENHWVALAQVGATVYSPKQQAWFQLTPASIRGVASEGMICSLEELDLAAQYPAPEEPGIWPINHLVSETDLGKPLQAVLKLPTEAILHSAPTANRGDHMAYLGVARELAALFNFTVATPPALTELPPALLLKEPAWQLDAVDEAVCPYYSISLLKNIRIEPSPDWMQQRLLASGVRPINNVVDITNYVMLETGHPLHAFDAGKLQALTAEAKNVSPNINLGVRHARPGEALTTLDAVERSLSEQAVVVTCNQHPVALAGVMGGASTAVDEQTTTVLLECATFPAASIRKSARSVGLRSESSARYERSVPASGCLFALKRALYLLQTLTGATPEGTLQTGAAEEPEVTLSLRLKRLAQQVGLTYTRQQVSDVLLALGFTVACNTPGLPEEEMVLTIGVPGFRQQDVKQEADLIEEVLRIVGYNQVPATLPALTLPPTLSKRQQALKRLHQFWQGAGFQEVSTASLVGPEAMSAMGFPLEEATTVGLVNSHSQEHTCLRQALLPSLLQVAYSNLSVGQTAVWVYEVGKAYFKRGKASHKQTGVQESVRLSVLLTGQPTAPSWRKTLPLDCLTLKGFLEGLLHQLQLPGRIQLQQGAVQAFSALPVEGGAHRFLHHPFLHPGQQAQLLWLPEAATNATAKTGKVIGWLGQVHPAGLKGKTWKQPVFALELELEPLLKACSQPITLQQLEHAPLNPYPAVERDLAFVVPESISYAALEAALLATEDERVQQVTLFDEYRGQGIAAEHRSLAVRFTFQCATQTLTDAVADSLLAEAKERLTAQFPVAFR